jgi:hypothetical protein
MNLQEAMALIKNYLEKMDALYGKTVFNEWAIVSFAASGPNVLNYAGARKADFEKNLSADTIGVRRELLSAGYGTGDCGFTSEGAGTGFDAFIVLGKELFLLCNSTTQATRDITQDPSWLKAQVPFAELAEKFRASPLQS